MRNDDAAPIPQLSMHIYAAQRHMPEVWQPQIFQTHLPVCSDKGFTKRRRPECQVCILGGIPPVQLLLDVLSNSGVCAYVMLLHQCNQVALRQPGCRLCPSLRPSTLVAGTTTQLQRCVLMQFSLIILLLLSLLLFYCYYCHYY